MVTEAQLKEAVAQPTAAELIRMVPRDMALVVCHLHLPADLVKKLTVLSVFNCERDFVNRL